MKKIAKIALMLLAVVAIAIGCKKDPDDPNGGGGGLGKYTVTFDANGGTGTMQSQVFKAGKKQALNANTFTREGYTFSSWNTAADASGKAYSDGEEIHVTENMTLYAQWKKNVANPLNGHEWVDLGLPSGTLWAKTNIDENIPELYQYYAWGESFINEGFEWGLYTYCNGTSTSMTKYCSKASYGYNGFTDTLTELEPEDDAATANWGNEWKMPDAVDILELKTLCTSTWTTQNGVNGMLFTGPNGNSIFFPAAGAFYGYSNGEGTQGGIWASTLYLEQPNQAFAMVYDSENLVVGSLDRYVGLSIRAVVK